MQTGALRQLDIKVNYACINVFQHPGYKIKDLCEKQGASLLLALCIHAILCGYIISNIILLIYIFNV